jgi:hypothetical protein
MNLQIPSASGISRNGKVILGGGFLREGSPASAYSVVNTASQLRSSSAAIGLGVIVFAARVRLAIRRGTGLSVTISWR